jgi:hypothetical protein
MRKHLDIAKKKLIKGIEIQEEMERKRKENEPQQDAACSDSSPLTPFKPLALKAIQSVRS